MKKRLQNTGMIHLQLIEEEELAAIIQSLGKVIQVTEVKVNENAKGLVNTERGLGFHTDHHKAKYILWHCKAQTDNGGESMMINAKDAYNQLTDNQQRALESVYLHEHKVFEDDVEAMPLVRIIDNVPHFYYSFWLLKKELTEEQKAAVQSFEYWLKHLPHHEIKLQPKDVLIIDNQFILHGRKPILGSQNRHLRRFWIA